MRTITIQIGNSDNKLTQKQWAKFIQCVDWQIVSVYGCKVHFYGFASPASEFQNAAWVVEAPATEENALRHRIANVAGRFIQESFAWTIGATELVTTK